jgi:hypothetical protein
MRAPFAWQSRAARHTATVAVTVKSVAAAMTLMPFSMVLTVVQPAGTAQ